MRNRRSLRAVLLFLAIALGLSAGYWFLYRLERLGLLSLDGLSGLLGAARGYGPTIAAVVVAWWVGGRSGLDELWRRLRAWRLPARLYGLALGIPLAAVSLVVMYAAWVEPSRLAPATVNPVKVIALFFVFIVVDGPLGEEIGWRGYLLPRLLEIVQPMTASLVIGVVWFAWHLPLYHAEGRALGAAFLISYLVLNVVCAILHTWLFLRSGGSAWLAVVFHTAGNWAFFVGATIFPGLRDLPHARLVHLLALCVMAAMVVPRLGASPAVDRAR